MMEENDGLVTENEVGDASMPVQVIQQHQMLDEASLQQLMDSGTVGEDSIIAIVHNENGEPQTVVLSRADAEALGIQLEPQNSVPMDGVEQMPEENLTEMVQEPQQEADILPPLVGEEPEPAPEVPQEIQEPPRVEEPEMVALDELPKVEEPQAEPESVPEPAGQSTSNDVLSNIIQSLFNPNEPNQSNVSIVPRMVGGKRKLCLRLPASTASALLAQTGAGGTNPLSGASVTSSDASGGMPKKIKIVIPPGSSQSSYLKKQQIITTTSSPSSGGNQKVIKIPITPKVAATNSSNTTVGPARLPEPGECLSPARSSSASKPFLASLFNSPTSSSSAVTVVPKSPVKEVVSSAPATPKPKPLGSTENPIQLVQEGNSFRSLQPLTPEQLKHIASVLKQNRSAILAGGPDGNDSKWVSNRATGGASGSDSGIKRKVVYDAASNTRIVYRVVTPGELKKTTPSPAPIAPKVSIAPKPTTSTSTPAAVTSTPSRGRGGRGRGRPGRPPKAATVAVTPLARGSGVKSGGISPDETDSYEEEEMEEEDVRSQQQPELSKEEREGKKKVLPRTRSGRVSKPPRHMVKDYKRLHHLDFAQPDLDDSDGGYSDYRIDGPADGVKGDKDGDSQPESDGVLTKKNKQLVPTSPFHCATCKREYTTPHRLTRHFEQFPDHSAPSSNGASPKRTSTSAEKSSKKPVAPSSASKPTSKNGQKKALDADEFDTPSDDEAEVISLPSSPPSPVKKTTSGWRGGWRGGPRGAAAAKGRGGASRGGSTGRGVGRPSTQQSAAVLAERRKVKLADILEMCTDEEVVEIAGPRLSAAMSSWEYLLLRVQQEEEGSSRAPLIPRLLNEATSLMDRVALVLGRHLHLEAGQSEGPAGREAYQLTSERTAKLIEKPTGTYYISKDDRCLLDEEEPDEVEAKKQPEAAPAVVEPESEAPSAEVESNKDLWEELEEASQLQAHQDGCGAAGSELMQVDEIVNQVVEDQTGSQAPSPL